MNKLTVKDLLELKRKRQFTEVYVSTPAEATACEEAGIDLIVTAESNNVSAIREAAPNTFLTVGLIYGDYGNSTEGVHAGFRNMKHGADAIYTGSGFKIIEAMANEGIPVIGHVGFIPYKASWFGGFKAVGKTAEEAVACYQRTLDYQNAGAIGVELEIVPSQVATEISKRVDILVLSMGSGPGCHGQYLFATDILGTNTGHVPRHAKVYRNLKEDYARLQQETIAAFKEFKEDVDTGAFPPESTLVSMKDDEFKKFMKSLES